MSAGVGSISTTSSISSYEAQTKTLVASTYKDEAADQIRFGFEQLAVAYTKMNDADAIACLLRRSPNLVCAHEVAPWKRSKEYGTVLHIAAAKGHSAVLRVLLTNGSKEDMDFSWNRTQGLDGTVKYGSSLEMMCDHETIDLDNFAMMLSLFQKKQPASSQTNAVLKQCVDRLNANPYRNKNWQSALDMLAKATTSINEYIQKTVVASNKSAQEKTKEQMAEEEGYKLGTIQEGRGLRDMAYANLAFAAVKQDDAAALQPLLREFPKLIFLSSDKEYFDYREKNIMHLAAEYQCFNALRVLIAESAHVGRLTEALAWMNSSVVILYNAELIESVTKLIAFVKLNMQLDPKWIPSEKDLDLMVKTFDRTSKA